MDKPDFKLRSFFINETAEFTLLPTNTTCIDLECKLDFPNIRITDIPRNLYLVTGDDDKLDSGKTLDISFLEDSSRLYIKNVSHKYLYLGRDVDGRG